MPARAARVLRPRPHAHRVIPDLDIAASELALVYRARGMSLSEAAPLRRALSKLTIGYGAAAVPYVLGLAFGASVV